MLLLSSKLQHLHVMSLQTGAKIAQVTSPVIDPSTLDIVAYHITGGGLNNALLLTRDIREVSGLGFIVDSVDELVQQTDMVKYQNILNLKFSLIDKQVIEESGEKLGKVYDYSLDPIDFRIYQLHVKKPIMKSLHTSSLIIHRQQIVEVNNKAIVVASTAIDATEKQASDQLVNPFRKAANASSQVEVHATTKE